MASRMARARSGFCSSRAFPTTSGAVGKASSSSIRSTTLVAMPSTSAVLTTGSWAMTASTFLAFSAPMSSAVPPMAIRPTSRFGSNPWRLTT